MTKGIYANIIAMHPDYFSAHLSAPGAAGSASTYLHWVKVDHSWPMKERSSRWYRSPRSGLMASVASSAL
jgi:hypothetical protein